ncbi:MAG: hypothetical protein WCL70_07370 [Paludibacter sp.]
MKRALKHAFKPKVHVHCEPTYRRQVPCDNLIKNKYERMKN